MKKLLSLLLCAVMLLALTACGGSASVDAGADATGAAPAAGDDVGEAAHDADTAEPADEATEAVDFYAMPLDYYTDEVLAGNREKLDQTPTGVDIHILNRFTAYLNEAEPAGGIPDVHMMWLYAEVPGDDGGNCYRPMNIILPAFPDDAPYYSEEPASGPQAIVNVRDDGPEEGDGYGKITTTTFYSSGIAREHFDALVAESTADEMFKTEDFSDEYGRGVFTEMYPGPFGMPSESGDTGEYRNHVVTLTTEIPGGGMDGTDLLCETHFEQEQETMISTETYNALNAFFSAIGVTYPEAAFMG